MSASAEIERLQQFAAELNRGNIDSVRQDMAADYFNYSPEGDTPKAYDVYFDILTDLKTAVSNLHFELSDLNANTDLITGLLTVSGTTDGPLWGAPATNKSVSWPVKVSIRVKDGRFELLSPHKPLPKPESVQPEKPSEDPRSKKRAPEWFDWWSRW